jgi:transposase InsO family protein
MNVPEVRDVFDERRVEYNHRRRPSGLGWRTPATYAAKLVD